MGQGGGKGGAKGNSSGGEGWEKVVPSHGDELLHKMVEVIQKNPGQVLALKSSIVLSMSMFTSFCFSADIPSSSF